MVLVVQVVQVDLKIPEVKVVSAVRVVMEDE